MGKWHKRYDKLFVKYVNGRSEYMSLQRKVTMLEAVADFAIVHLLTLNDALNIDPEVFGDAARVAYLSCYETNGDALYRATLDRELNNAFALYPVYTKEYLSKDGVS